MAPDPERAHGGVPGPQGRGGPWHWLAPLALLGAFTLPHLNQGEFNVDTGWYAAIALQAWRALLGGHPAGFWTLWAEGGEGGIPYFNKPPLAFWLNGVPLVLFGPTVAAARLGSIIAAAGAVAATGAIGRAVGGARAGLVAGLILASTIEFTRHGRSFSLDLWLALFLTLAVLATVLAAVRGRPALIALAGLPVGLALLVKPLAPLIALGIIAAWLLASGRGRWAWWTVAAAVLAVAVAAPWYGAMAATHGDAFMAQHFGREIADRAAGEFGQRNIGAASLWYYPGVLVRSGWPWLVTAVGGLVAWACGWRGRGAARRTGAVPLMAFWIIAWCVLLSLFAYKAPRYLLVVHPAAAVLSALWLEGLSDRIEARAPGWDARWARRITLGAGVVGVALAAAPIRFDRPANPQWPALFAWMRERGAPEVWQGGLVGARGARLYLELGRWPIPTRDHSGSAVAEPPPGSLLLYHRRDGWAPGPNEVEEFGSGDLRVMRLGAGGWRPSPSPDPSE